MDTSHYKRALQKKEKDLLADIERLEADARAPQDSEVHDEIDEVMSAESRATAFTASTIEYQTLQQVRDALQRIEDGTYGRCVDCGREIPAARLEAVPWTPYCIEDQEKHDKEASA